MHGAAIFVWSVVDGLSRGVLDEVVLSVSWDVGHVNGDVRITVVSRLEVEDTESVHRLVDDGSDDFASIADRDILDSTDHTNVRVASSSVDEAKSVGGSGALDECETGAGGEIVDSSDDGGLLGGIDRGIVSVVDGVGSPLVVDLSNLSLLSGSIRFLGLLLVIRELLVSQLHVSFNEEIGNSAFFVDLGQIDDVLFALLGQWLLLSDLSDFLVEFLPSRSGLLVVVLLAGSSSLLGTEFLHSGLILARVESIFLLEFLSLCICHGIGIDSFASCGFISSWAGSGDDHSQESCESDEGEGAHRDDGAELEAVPGPKLFGWRSGDG